MKTIHKLVLKAYLGPMIMTFFIVMFILMMNVLWRYIDELVGKGLSTGIIIELLTYSLTNLIPLGLPLATLLAAIMTLGNLGENYELLAMKSAGLSLPRIIRPLIYLVIGLSIGSFFIANNLVPWANKKFYSTLNDIRQMNPTLEFQDGLFFNGIPQMSIRVGHQDPETGLLTNVLIYDNRDDRGQMQTTLADSGYIRISDDKRFLDVLLFGGERYAQARGGGDWYNASTLQRSTFARGENHIKVEGFAMGERTDENEYAYASQTKNMHELSVEIDSLTKQVGQTASRSYDPVLKGGVFLLDTMVLRKAHYKGAVRLLDSLPRGDVRAMDRLYQNAATDARGAASLLNFDEATTKRDVDQLYQDEGEWHKKLALPFSILIFFLIGAPLGAIIRKGGLGMPVVVSIGFFVIYYVISTLGEKAVKEGNLDAIYGMWLSTIILTPIAFYLTYKATNDSGLLDTEWYYTRWQKLKKWIRNWIPSRRR